MEKTDKLEALNKKKTMVAVYGDLVKANCRTAGVNHDHAALLNTVLNALQEDSDFTEMLALQEYISDRQFATVFHKGDKGASEMILNAQIPGKIEYTVNQAYTALLDGFDAVIKDTINQTQDLAALHAMNRLTNQHLDIEVRVTNNPQITEYARDAAKFRAQCLQNIHQYAAAADLRLQNEQGMGR